MAFWTLNIVFVMFAHKLPLIRKLGAQSWKMFVFKVGAFIGGFATFKALELSAEEIHIEQLYQQLRLQYSRYKRSGDMREICPDLILEEI